MAETIPQKLDDILEEAERLANDGSPDDAARFLAPYRRAVCDRLHDSPSSLGDLVQICAAQVHYLNEAGTPDKAAGVAEWFLHRMHHLEEDFPEVDFRMLRRALCESFSRFFRRYARSLRDLDRIEEMRIAMRNALDLTREIPMAVVSLVHLYRPLRDRENLEDEPAPQWLLKRYAEALAALDFAGLHDIPFREALDNGQYAMRCPDKRDEMKLATEALCAQNAQDVALQTLFQLLF